MRERMRMRMVMVGLGCPSRVEKVLDELAPFATTLACGDCNLYASCFYLYLLLRLRRAE